MLFRLNLGGKRIQDLLMLVDADLRIERAAASSRPHGRRHVANLLFLQSRDSR